MKYKNWNVELEDTRELVLDIKNYKKAVFYKEQSFYTDPSKVNFNDEETIQWIGYIITQRQFDYLESYKFSEYLFEIGKIKNDYEGT